MKERLLAETEQRPHRLPFPRTSTWVQSTAMVSVPDEQRLIRATSQSATAGTDPLAMPAKFSHRPFHGQRSWH
jgi:hypothetical protein